MSLPSEHHSSPPPRQGDSVRVSKNRCQRETEQRGGATETDQRYLWFSIVSVSCSLGLVSLCSPTPTQKSRIRDTFNPSLTKTFEKTSHCMISPRNMSSNHTSGDLRVLHLCGYIGGESSSRSCTGRGSVGGISGEGSDRDLYWS